MSRHPILLFRLPERRLQHGWFSAAWLAFPAKVEISTNRWMTSGKGLVFVYANRRCCCERHTCRCNEVARNKFVMSPFRRLRRSSKAEMDNVVVFASDGAGAGQPAGLVIRQKWERPITELQLGTPQFCVETTL